MVSPITDLDLGEFRDQPIRPAAALPATALPATAAVPAAAAAVSAAGLPAAALPAAGLPAAAVPAAGLRPAGLRAHPGLPALVHRLHLPVLAGRHRGDHQVEPGAHVPGDGQPAGCGAGVGLGEDALPG